MRKGIPDKKSAQIAKIFLFMIFFVLMFGLFSVEIKDPDFWWHLKTGEYIHQHGALPETDPFAFTSLTKDPIDPQSKRIKFILTQYWFAQTIFYWVYHLSGFQGIIYLRAFLLTLLLLLLYKGIRREGGGFYLSLGLLVPAGIILRAFTGERPQLFSFLFAFLLIYLLEGFRKTSGIRDTEETVPRPYHVKPAVYLVPIPFIMLLWANLHGGFILGMVIILGYLSAETFKYIFKRFGSVLSRKQLGMLIGAGIISVITPLINPNGYNVFSVLIEFEKSSYKGMIVESMPPLFLFRSGFHDVYLVIYFLLLCLCLLAFLLNRKKFDLTDGVIMSSLAVISFSSSRYIPFFSPAAVFMIVRYGTDMLDKLPQLEALRKIREKADLSLSVIATIILIIVINNSNLFKSGIKANNYPEGAVKFLKANRISGNMFNPYVWGGYLMWALYPDYKVFIDGRGLIGEVFFQEVKIMEASPENIAGLPAWKAFLNVYNVSSIITYSVGNFTGRIVPLIPSLLHDPEWRLVYFDNISLIFVRDNVQNSEIIKRFDLPKEWLWNEVAVEAALKSHDYRGNINYLITEGDALLQKQSYADAKAAYLKALQIDPQNRLVQKRLDFVRTAGY
jgi:hypothetical protein